jgi:hypothetical protein
MYMSQALASARKRRAPTEPIRPSPLMPQQPNQQPNQQQQPPVTGLTLPQVISLVDKRLTTLEKHMNESKMSTFQTSAPSDSIINEVPSNLTEILDEFNARHELLANEIGTLKNLVMNLQSYTMDVNKMLLQERVKILSDLGDDEEDKSLVLKQEFVSEPIFLSSSSYN